MTSPSVFPAGGCPRAALMDFPGTEWRADSRGFLDRVSGRHGARVCGGAGEIVPEHSNIRYACIVLRFFTLPKLENHMISARLGQHDYPFAFVFLSFLFFVFFFLFGRALFRGSVFFLVL